MGYNKKWKNKDIAKEQLDSLIEVLDESLKPFLKYEGNLDLSKVDPTVDNGDTLARIINSLLKLTEDEQDNYFGADSVIAQKVEIERNEVIRLWGKIFWLSIPENYESYKEGYDPFYGGFQLVQDKLQIMEIRFGDYDKTNLDKIWWFDLELNWIYEFK